MGGSKTVVQSAVQPPIPTVGESTADVYNAQLEYLPKVADLFYQLQADPDSGTLATTLLNQRARAEAFPGEEAVRNQLVDVVLQNLISPTGISPEQQAATDAIRAQTVGDYTEALRNRQNLGGTLYGGRSIQQEQRGLADIYNLFAAEDIDREERARLNAQQSAYPLLQILLPEVGITPPQFESPVPNANTAFGGALQARGQDIGVNSLNAQLANDAANRRSSLQSSLYGALGQAGGSYMGNTAGWFGTCWVAAEIFGGWYHPKTVGARHFIGNIAPKWFRDFYVKHGEKIAKYISDKPVIKAILWPLFEIFSFIGRKRLLAM